MSSSGSATLSQTVAGQPKNAELHSSPPPMEMLLEQVERILRSETMSTSDVLRKLLLFLAQKTANGEADDLKEYTVAIDGLDKPASYDPRQTSAVRIQAGRLRQKLQEYYRDEAPGDLLIVGLPKGHFRLTCRWADAVVLAHDLQAAPTVAPPPEEPLPMTKAAEPAHRFRNIWKLVAICTTVLGVALAGSNVYLLRKESRLAPSFGARDRSDSSRTALGELWQPFLASKRPLLLVAEDPLFVEFKTGGGVYFRDPKLRSWENAEEAPDVAALRKVFKGGEIEPNHQYTSFAEARATFLIGRLFGEQNENLISLVKASEVSHEQVGDDNLLLIGISPDAFADELRSLTGEVELVPTEQGIEVLHPQAGELRLYKDAVPTSGEQGSVYALISHIPGPLHETDIESFVSNRSSGYVAAVRAFSDESLARDIVPKLKRASGGQVPRYFQVLLKVTFKNSLPIQTICVMARPLH